VPIKDGIPLAAGVRRQDFSGAALADLMAGVLTERGYPLTLATPSERVLARDVMEKHCYVALDCYGRDQGRDGLPCRLDDDDVRAAWGRQH